MTSEDLFAYQDTLTRAVKDIHDRCGPDINVLWDSGRVTMVTATHHVKVWNGLGSVELQIEHDDLAAGGPAYQRFLEKIASAAKEKLTLEV